MATPFLSSEEYDERAHQLYNEGDYDAALETLKEGLLYYPNSAELHVGLGYARLAREEFAWAKQAFEKALVLDAEHEEALVGLGEVLLRFGRHGESMRLFTRARQAGAADDLELLLSMGRALYRERLYAESRRIFEDAAALHPESADAAAALGYVLHRLQDEDGARLQLRRALQLDPAHHEARIFLGHLLYDRGQWETALREFEAVPPSEHWDPVSLWRVVELKRAFLGLEQGDPLLRPWEDRLDTLESDPDPVDVLLDELETNGCFNAPQLELFDAGADRLEERHEVRTADGTAFAGTWFDIVRQLRDADGLPGETVAEYMRRRAESERVRSGRRLPVDDPEAFVRASASAGLLRIER